MEFKHVMESLMSMDSCEVNAEFTFYDRLKARIFGVGDECWSLSRKGYFACLFNCGEEIWMRQLESL